MVHPHVSRHILLALVEAALPFYPPLKIIRTWISVFALRTKWTDISWASVDQPVSNHFILSLETLPSFRPRAVRHWAVVGSVLSMYVVVRALNSKLNLHSTTQILGCHSLEEV